MAHGELAARMARKLSPKPEFRGYDVLFDHGDKEIDPPDKVGRIVSWFGSEYKRDARLAFLDIAVVSRDSGKVFALIEIEESTSKPKVLLGDVLATLLGDKITFQGKRDLKVGRWTKLIAIAHTNKTAQIAFLRDQVNQLRPLLSTSNASIGQIVIDTFDNEPELETKLTQAVEHALQTADTLTR